MMLASTAHYMNISSSQVKLFAIVAGIVLIFVLVFSFFTKGTTGSKQDVNLVVWGVGDTQGDLQKSFDGFVSLVKQGGAYGNVNFTMTYRSWRPDEYENLLLNQLAEGKGPDIFYIHNTWLPKYQNKLIPLPAEQMSLDDFSSQFVAVAAQDLVYDRQIYSLPHYVDTLATYYNTQQYQGGATETSRPASTWAAFKSQAAALTIKDGETITRSGAALGATGNIKHAIDVLYLYLVQKGGAICGGRNCNTVSVSSNVAFRDAVREFLSYSDTTSSNYSWSTSYLDGLQTSNMFNDIDAFIRGRVSTVFGYASDYEQISRLGSTNNLKFEVAEIPQFDSTAGDKVAFASYWSMAVSRNTAHPQLAWDFIKYMTTRPVLAEYYAVHPRPVSREDMINTSTDNPLRVFDRQSKYARSLVIYDDARFAQVLRDVLAQLAVKSVPFAGVMSQIEDALSAVMASYKQVDL